MIWFCDHFCIQVSTQDSAFPASFEDPQLKHFVVIHQGYYDPLDAIAKNPRAHPSDNKEKDFVRAEFLPQALTSSYCLLAAIGREIDVFCQLDLSIVKRAL